MTRRTCAVDIVWKTGNVDRVATELPYRAALAYAKQMQKSEAVAWVRVVRVVTTETRIRNLKGED